MFAMAPADIKTACPPEHSASFSPVNADLIKDFKITELQGAEKIPLSLSKVSFFF